MSAARDASLMAVSISLLGPTPPESELSEYIFGKLLQRKCASDQESACRKAENATMQHAN
jgi:hypothetical protein